MSRPYLFTDERRAEREGVLGNAIGAVWLAAIGGAITKDDAERIHRELTRAADQMTWSLLDGETRH